MSQPKTAEKIPTTVPGLLLLEQAELKEAKAQTDLLATVEEKKELRYQLYLRQCDRCEKFRALLVASTIPDDLLDEKTAEIRAQWRFQDEYQRKINAKELSIMDPKWNEYIWAERDWFDRENRRKWTYTLREDYTNVFLPSLNNNRNIPHSSSPMPWQYGCGMDSDDD